jgi:hypothetical protein
MALDRSAADLLDVTDSIIRNGGVSASWQYTLSTEPKNGAVNSDDLVREIRSSAIVTALDYINTDEGGDKLDINFKAALSGASALSATYTWDGTTTVASSDTSETEVGEWIRLDSDNQWFKVVTVNTDVSVIIENPDALTIPTGATQSSKGGDVRILQGNASEPRTPGSILGDHEGSAVTDVPPSWISVLDKDLATPPVSPTIGDKYIVATGGTGDWSGHDDEISSWNGTAWVFNAADEGLAAVALDDGLTSIFRSSAWELLVALDRIDPSGAADGELIHWNDTLGRWEATEAISGLVFNEAPTANGLLYIIGWYIPLNTAASLTSAAPVTADEAGYHSHFVVDISAASGLPFTVRVAGTSVDESTGDTTVSDTEDLAVTANGYYQTTKSWLDAVQFSIVEGSKSCTVDVYRITYWDKGNANFRILGCRLEWTPDAISWSIRLRVLHIENDGNIDLLDDVTFDNNDTPLRAEKDKPGKYKRGDYGHPNVGAENEGIIIEIDQSGIGQIFLEIKYDGGH